MARRQARDDPLREAGTPRPSAIDAPPNGSAARSFQERRQAERHGACGWWLNPSAPHPGSTEAALYTPRLAALRCPSFETNAATRAAKMYARTATQNPSPVRRGAGVRCRPLDQRGAKLTAAAAEARLKRFPSCPHPCPSPTRERGSPRFPRALRHEAVGIGRPWR